MRVNYSPLASLFQEGINIFDLFFFFSIYTHTKWKTGRVAQEPHAVNKGEN